MRPMIAWASEKAETAHEIVSKALWAGFGNKSITFIALSRLDANLLGTLCGV
jgi:hypothetical protein